MCQHRPPCPAADRPDRDAARTVAIHPEQGWSVLGNGVLLLDDLDDLGELVSGGRAGQAGAGPAPSAGRRGLSRPDLAGLRRATACDLRRWSSPEPKIAL